MTLLKGKPTLYLIRGLPGSGKSSLAEKMLATGMVDYYFEADEHFVDKSTGVYTFDKSKLFQYHALCREDTVKTLMNGWNVAVSNTSTTSGEVELYQQIAESYEANFVSIVVENRHGNKDVHNVPKETVERMKQRFDICL